MEQKNVYTTTSGMKYEMTVSWNPDIALTENVFPIRFDVVDKDRGLAVKLPREIATFAIGDPAETLGDRVDFYYGGDKNAMFVDYIETAMRRAMDYVERGR